MLLKQKSSNLPKFIIIITIILLVGTLFGAVFYLLKLEKAPGALIKINQVKSIELSQDKKAVLNSETKETIFTIEEANKYIFYYFEYQSEYAKSTKDKIFADDCIADAALSNKKDKIVFSTRCFEKDSQEAWVGIHNIITPSKCLKGAYCETRLPEFQYLMSGAGKNFIWFEDDEFITYETDPGLSGLTEIRTINLLTGAIQESKMDSAGEIDISD